MEVPSFPVTIVLFFAVCILVFPGESLVISGISEQYSESGIVLVPYVTGTTDNSTVVHWFTKNFTPDHLQYANESFYSSTGFYDHAVIVNTTSPSHFLTLTGLEPGARYHYALQSGTITSGDRWFMTYPETSSCSFIVYGDTREQAPYFTQLERHKMVADRIATEPNISFVVNTGDLVSNSDDYEEWNRFFSAGKTLLGTTTYVPVRGNHDSNLTFLQDLFGNAGTYSFECGDVHVSVLDSDDYSRLPPGEQTRWLVEDLASAAGTWKIVILHHPLYTSEENHFGGFEHLRTMFEPAFLSGNVSVVFNGHVHAFERIEKSGITYITEGRGGAPAYGLNETKMAGSKKSRENTLGYSRVTIDPVSETMRIDVIQVAGVSPDLRTVTKIYEDDMVIEQITIRKPGYVPGSTLRSPSFLPGIISCISSGDLPEQQSSPDQFPLCFRDIFWSNTFGKDDA